MLNVGAPRPCHRISITPLGTLGSLAIVAWLFLLAGCTSLPQQVERPPSYALPNPEQTALGRIVAATKRPAGASGFQLITSGDVAYETRLALIDRAERTLDLQYFIVQDDVTTRALIARLQQAVARGVRVRILIDGLYQTKLSLWLEPLVANSNIQVRLFNPFPSGRRNPLLAVLTLIGDLEQLTRRMHNKLFIVDNTLAICGGRNLGNEYFARHGDFNFADLDLMAAGPVVRALSHSFDTFWNNELAYPIAMFGDSSSPRKRDPDDYEEKAGAAASLLSSTAPGVASTRAAIASGKFKLAWASARALSDNPSKVTLPAEGDGESVGEEVLQILGHAKREVLVISPYLVPGNAVMDVFRDLRKRGVTVRVLTNSLATTDVPAAHAGYARRRPELLQLGIEVHELKPAPPRIHTQIFGDIGRSRASLHAKALIVDERIFFVGSMNLDPRSVNRDTENGIVVNSTALATQLVSVFEHGAAPTASYRVRLAADGTQVEWLTREGDAEKRFTEEPETQLWQRLFMGVWQITAPEDQL